MFTHRNVLRCVPDLTYLPVQGTKRPAKACFREDLYTLVPLKDLQMGVEDPN